MLVGIFPHRAGVEDHEVRMQFVFGHGKTDLLQDAGKLLRIAGIHLTAEGHDRCQRRAFQAALRVRESLAEIVRKL